MSSRLSPHLVSFEPATSIDDLLPDLELSWSVDVDTSFFSDPIQLPNYVTVHNEATGVNVPLTYISYDALNKTVTLRPTSNLSSGATYRVTVKPGIQSTERRTSQASRSWTFSINSSGLSTPSSLQPDSYKTYPTFPTLSWSDTAPTYLVQIATEPKFTTTLESRLLADNSFLTSESYSLGSTYYWRVIGISGAVSSDWSEIGTFRYSTQPPIDESTNTYEANKPFYITTYGFENDHTHLASYPTISFTFSEDLDSDELSKIVVWKSKTTHSNLNSSLQGKLSWSGSWAISGKTATFTPSETISTNTRYTIQFPKGFLSEEGNALHQTVNYFFTGKYTPYYANYDMVASRIGREAEILDPDLVNYFIHEASKSANSLFYAALGVTHYQIGPEGMDETQVEVNSLKSAPLRNWVTCEAVSLILRRALNSELRNIGRDLKIANYSEGLSVDFVKGAKVLLESIREEQAMYTSQVYGTIASYTVSNQELI